MLAFAASGISGMVLGDFAHRPAPGEPPTGGNVMAAMTGRLGASADSVHSAGVFVINAEGTSFLRRPQDFSLEEVDRFGELARRSDFAAIHQMLKVPVSDHRTSVPRDVPYIFPFNKWSRTSPGPRTSCPSPS